MTWESRDLPVLRAVVTAADEGCEYVYPDQIAKRTGLELATVQRSLFALAPETPGFFTLSDASGPRRSRDL